ncbi:hypothetical protein QE424_002470 [Stenotrophomonas rhizophila]|uniref:Uncharacterized protein n=1 Tax=Stenotrophomonas rhizophila TaxID=216778 RepID=A0AAP5AJM1_9GAMM|nr:hypothetical protein [Stenotrophomonas rhizophila]MDQ1109311.1 hypothetical protein [Stenotrophomonas rhizophila]
MEESPGTHGADVGKGHFEGVVLDSPRAYRALFVNSQCYIQLNEGSNPDTSGPHWYFDALAVSFKERAAFLCEITYAARAASLIVRLKAWNEHWPGVSVAMERDSGEPAEWIVRPWLFVLEAHIANLRYAIGGLTNLPSPRFTPLEEVVPWRYRSWDRGAYVDPSP